MILTKKSTAAGPISSKPTYFSDFDLDMVRNPSTGDIIPLKNELAIRRSVRNLILFNFGEKPFNPTLGSNVRRLLFDPMTPDVAGRLQSYIIQTLETYETRVQINAVECIPDYSSEGYNVTIRFFLLNSQSEAQTISMFLERLR